MVDILSDMPIFRPSEKEGVSGAAVSEKSPLIPHSQSDTKVPAKLSPHIEIPEIYINVTDEQVGILMYIYFSQNVSGFGVNMWNFGLEFLLWSEVLDLTGFKWILEEAQTKLLPHLEIPEMYINVTDEQVGIIIHWD